MISNNCITRHIKHAILFLLLAAGTAPAWAVDITALSQITDPSGNYVITDNINASSFATSIVSFSGTLEAAINPDTHMPYRIKNLSEPIFTTLTGTVKNLVLEDVSISGHTGNTGAIACEASGDARIYNVGILSGSVGGTGYTGGLVGLLNNTETGGARVINCYSFANITGGSEKAGIVGHNNYASKANAIRTMVMNCMFYGDIASGGTVAPIYGGVSISNDYDSSKRPNDKLNNYNYFLYEAPFSKNNTTNNVIITKYNCALAAEERFLVRFEFYRHLLNSTRELAAWYVTGNPNDGKGVGAANKMLKWVLDKGIASYPILKEQGTYPSVVNYDPEETYDSETGQNISRSSVTERNKGGFIKSNNQTKTLTVNIVIGSGAPSGASIKNGKSQITLKCTDKDFDDYNFNYDKVQLPYYNEVGNGNYTENKVVTGWKITVAGGNSTYTTTNYDAPNYNFADRDCTGKDNYNTSGRVFAQGAYFNVPTGVTSISIEPYWGKAVYLSDACYDRYGYNTTDNLTQVGGGQRYTNNTNCPVLAGNQKVYTKLKDNDGALAALSGVNNPTVYDYAVVLVGNYHHHTTEGQNGGELSDGTKPFTIMSIDLNEDNEPDYCLIYRSGKNKNICPIRYDFITVPGMVMAHKMASNGDLGIPGNCVPRGWFEVTTTGLIKFGQFMHSYNQKTLAPLILMGGIFDQFVSNNTTNKQSNEQYTNRTQYMILGDNVWFKLFSNGAHMDHASPTPHRPMSVIGGEFEKLYLSGYFRPDANVCTTGQGDNNAECYIDGGKFGEVAGAGQERISGNVTWLVDHADIESFYGGGIKASNEIQITGNINTMIKNSQVKLFCGGPQFGDMTAASGDTPAASVTTNATNCTFGTFFGAGFGGTSIYRDPYMNEYQKKNYNWNNDYVNKSFDNSSGGSYRGKYTLGKGIACGYEYEFFGGSAGNIGRLYIKYASFSLATTHSVTSNLTGCTITGNFYGGGSRGKVEGDVTSTLDNCIVNGSVFGAGYSATIPTATVLSTGGFSTEPNYNETTGVYEKEEYPSSADYTWTNVESLSNGNQAIEGNSIKTTLDLSKSNLGSVSGNVILTLKGDTKVGTLQGQTLIENTGNVYGGGDESYVTGAGHTITVNMKDNTEVYGDVFGGGNKGLVEGNTEVNIINE